MKSNKNIALVILFLIIGACARWIPHLPNFTPTEALALFGAAHLSKRYLAILLPLLLWYISDFVLNNTILRSFYTETEGTIWFSNYMIYNAVAIVFIVLLGRKLLQKVTAGNVVLASITSSIMFFLVTNFGSWAHGASFYTRDFSGLMASYMAGLPFFATSMLSTLLFSGILFGSFHLISSMIYGIKKTATQKG